jgi:Mrp family chromosome partitioning ATPase
VDLPPVSVVSDAVAMSKVRSGVVLVVRNGVAEQKLLAEALRQLKLVNVRILGFVYRDMERVGRKYGSKYGKRYKYYRYYRSYVESGRNSDKKEVKQ